jgi:uncharacterized membrane protein YphA (DoxX/SURF4 family)
MAPAMPKPQAEAVQTTHYSHQAYLILLCAFALVPIIAGLDKFFHVLVDWNQYLAPIVPRLTGIDGGVFMMIVGVIEIIAGIIVAVKPKFGGLLVAAWLWGIIVNLLLIPGYYDIALRDFGLSLGAIALARLSNEFTS